MKILSPEEYDKVFDTIFDDFRFDPIFRETDPPDKPWLIPPCPFVRYHLNSVWNEAQEKLINEMCKKIVGGEMFALDYHHEAIIFDPDENISPDYWFHDEERDCNVYFPTYYPNGDYFFFSSLDFGTGLYGHPWKNEIIVCGNDLIKEFEKAEDILDIFLCGSEFDNNDEMTAHAVFSKSKGSENVNIICDIRIYKSDIPNIDGNGTPSGFATKALNIKINRIVMKLRESGFVLSEDFDHLYINFTNCVPEGTFQLSGRSVHREDKRRRYYDVGVSETIFSELNDHYSGKYDNELIELTRQTLLRCFSDNVETDEIINAAFETAKTEGEKMLMRFKEKKSAKNKAVIYLRLLDDGNFFPLLCVYDSGGNEIFREDLPLTRELSPFGEIRLSSKKITVCPRKNFFTQDMQPISFELK